MSVAERVRRSRWAGQVEVAAEKLHRLLLDAPIPMPKEPVIDLDLIDALIALCDYPSVPVTNAMKRKFRVREKNQRDWMRQVAEELGYDEQACVKAYADLDEQGIAPRKRRTISSYDYALALWKDGVNKGWLGLSQLEGVPERREERTVTRKAYSEKEIVLCTYLARFGRSLLTESKIAIFGRRSEGSVKMKVQNIVAMLDEKGIQRCPDYSSLTGLTTGEVGRETNWPQIENLVTLEKAEHWSMCKEILAVDR